MIQTHLQQILNYLKAGNKIIPPELPSGVAAYSPPPPTPPYMPQSNPSPSMVKK